MKVPKLLYRTLVKDTKLLVTWKESNVFFVKNESICYFNIFKLLSFDTALQKKWGTGAPRPPGFDPTEIRSLDTSRTIRFHFRSSRPKLGLRDKYLYTNIYQVKYIMFINRKTITHYAIIEHSPTPRKTWIK